MSDDEIAAVIKKHPPKHAATPINTPFDPDKYLAQTAPVDLKKITLFDVAPGFEHKLIARTGRSESYSTCTGFYGRLRNDLPRTVEKIGVKASFYNAQWELIEVRTFWLQLFAGNVPNAPVSFRNENDVRVDHLPDGWRYQLEVIEAQYVK